MNLLPKNDTEIASPVLIKSMNTKKKKKKSQQIKSFDMSSSDLDTSKKPHSKKESHFAGSSWNKKSRLFFSLLSISIFIFIFISVFVIGFLIQLRNAEINYANKYRDIYVSSVPRDANVYIDNEIKGITPLVIHNVLINKDRELKLRKFGFDTFTTTINVDNVQETYNITLDSIGVNTSVVNISKLGISLTVPDAYKPNNVTFTTSRSDVKDSLIEIDQYPNVNQNIDYIKYKFVLTAALDTYFEIDPYSTLDICSNGTQADCQNGFALNSSQKIKKVTVLGQELYLMRALTGELFVYPELKVSGSDFNAIIIKSNKISPDIFENLLSSIDKY